MSGVRYRTLPARWIRKRALLPVFQASNAPFVRMRDPRQAVNALHHVRQENFVLLVRLFILLLHARNQLYALRQRLVAFSQLVEPLIDIHPTTSVPEAGFFSATPPMCGRPALSAFCAPAVSSNQDVTGVAAVSVAAA